jgi:hypothetical protein
MEAISIPNSSLYPLFCISGKQSGPDCSVNIKNTGGLFHLFGQIPDILIPWIFGTANYD